MVLHKQSKCLNGSLLTLTLLAAITIPFRAQADPLSSIVVYGDSLSDNGNLFAVSGQPGAPYYNGRRSNGPVAVEQLAANLGAPLIDFAWIGATTGIGNYADGGTPTSFGTYSLPGMLTEFNSTKQSLTPYLGGLFIVWGGPNDFISPSPLDSTPQQVINRGVSDILTIVNGLKSLGATNILVPGMPDLGLTPDFASQGPIAAAAATAATNAFNAALISQLPVGVTYFDTASLLRSIVANPAAYGFTDAKDACFTGTSLCADPSTYVFFDNLHPTTQADALLAQEFAVAVAAPEPGTVTSVAGALFAIAIFQSHRVRKSRRQTTAD
jgi:cholinesterase